MLASLTFHAALAADTEPPVVHPGEHGQPPSDAIVLFDGKDLSKWESVEGSGVKWIVKDGCAQVAGGSIRTREEFGPVQLHVNLLWNDNKYRSDTPTWFRARTNMTISGKVNLTKHWQTYFSIHNVLNAPYNVIIPGNAYPSTAAAGLGAYSAIYVQNGQTFTFGVRARF